MANFFISIDQETGYFTAGRIRSGNPKVEGALSVTHEEMTDTMMYWLAGNQPPSESPPVPPEQELNTDLFDGMGETTLAKLMENGISTVDNMAKSNFTAVRAAGVHHVNPEIVSGWVKTAQEMLR